MIAEKNARDYTISLQNAVRGKRVEFTQTFFKRYAREFKTALQQDKTEPQTLEKAIPYIADLWDTQQLPVGRAVAGVQANGSLASEAGQGPEDRIRGYEHLFALSERQEAMERLIEKRGAEAVLAWVRERPEELEEYLEKKIVLRATDGTREEAYNVPDAIYGRGD